MLLRRLSSAWAFALLSALFALLSGSDDAHAAFTTLAAEPPRKSNGLTDVVQWDNYTLFLHDQRMFL